MRAFTLPISLLLISLCRPASADPPQIQAIPPGEDQIVVLREGQPAPFSGQLFDNPTALRWANFLKQYRERLSLDSTYQQALCAASMEVAGRRLSFCEEKYKKVSSYLEQELSDVRKELRDPPFYKNVWFGVAGGILLTTVVVGVAVALVSALR